MTKPTILVFVLVLILNAEAKMAKKCPDCGTHSIPYPLSTGPDCGDQKYNRIVCENNATLHFRSANNTYPITSISPDTRSLVIAPSEFMTNGTCASQDLNTNGLQLDPTAPFAITRNNTVFFLNCTDSILRAPINCSPGNLCHVYANNATDGAKACSNSTICCYYNPTGARSSFQMIRLRKEGCMAYRSFVNLDPNLDIQDWPSPGVQLMWADPAGQ